MTEFITDTSAHEAEQLKLNKDYDPAADPVVRKSGLGGSSMPTILGVNRWMSPLELWARMRDEWPADLERPEDPHELMRIGSQFEAPICDMLAEDWNLKIARIRRTMRHPKIPWAMAHPDRRVIGKYKGKKAFLEAKMTGLRHMWGEPGTDEVPDYVMPQVHHEMWVGDADLVIVPVMFVEFRAKREYYIVERDPEWDEILYEHGKRFWECVTEGIEPPVQYQNEATQDAIKRLYGNYEPDTFVAFGENEQHLVSAMEQLAERREQCEKGEDAIKAELIHRLGRKQYAQLPDGRWWRAKQTKRKAYQVEETTYTEHRLVKELPKGVEPPKAMPMIGEVF